MAVNGTGALRAIRTPDPQLRRLLLYPAELGAQQTLCSMAQFCLIVNQIFAIFSAPPEKLEHLYIAAYPYCLLVLLVFYHIAPTDDYILSSY